jgi:hypothetical protein
MTRILILLTAVALLAVGAAPAVADTATVTTSTGYQVTLTGPTTATVGVPTTYTATCGPIGWYGSPCPYGEFRAYGGPINRLGEGFGTGATGRIVFRAPGYYQIRYRVGASCPGSPRLACPIDVWLSTTAT